MDIEKIAKAIEADAGMALDDVRQGLAEMKAMTGNVHTPEQILVRSARLKIGLSQQAFADLIKTPVPTLRDWEQGRFAPSGGIMCLLKLLLSHPEMADELRAA